MDAAETDAHTRNGECVCLVSNARYQGYLDFMLAQLEGCGMDTFVICGDDVRVDGTARRIRAEDQTALGDVEVYPPNRNLDGSLKRLMIPYAEELSAYRKVLYLDLDIELRSGWESAFLQRQSRPVLATPDVAMGPWFAKRNRMEDFYEGRPFEYCNAGVLLFDLGMWGAPPSEIRRLVDVAIERKWLYADQDVLNASGLVDVSLDPRFNTYSHLSDGSTLISHYTAAEDAKERFNRLMEERRSAAK